MNDFEDNESIEEFMKDFEDTVRVDIYTCLLGELVQKGIFLKDDFIKSFNKKKLNYFKDDSKANSSFCFCSNGMDYRVYVYNIKLIKEIKLDVIPF